MCWWAEAALDDGVPFLSTHTVCTKWYVYSTPTKWHNAYTTQWTKWYDANAGSAYLVVLHPPSHQRGLTHWSWNWKEQVRTKTVRSCCRNSHLNNCRNPVEAGSPLLAVGAAQNWAGTELAGSDPRTLTDLTCVQWHETNSHNSSQERFSSKHYGEVQCTSMMIMTVDRASG